MMSLIEPDTYLRAMGVAGFALYVINYTCLSRRWISGDCLTFFAINTTAAAMVLGSNVVDFNLASVLIQVFWIIIGLNAIFLRRKQLVASTKRV